MNIKWQTLLLIAIVFGSLMIMRTTVDYDLNKNKEAKATSGIELKAEPESSFYSASLLSSDAVEIKKAPSRNWDVADPQISSEAVLIQSLDDQFPFYHYNTYYSWPTASLAKLLTSVVVLEEIGDNKKISVTKNAVDTEGRAGDIKDGEIYAFEDLLKIMLLTSSNDAATAFEEHFGGRETFVKLMNLKAQSIGMSRSRFYDAAGLSESNESTAGDMLNLARYILDKHSEIFNWTRTPSFLIQAINQTDSRMVENINPLVNDSNFLGGKTGTSDESKENLVSIFNFDNKRVAIIILGSRNRITEVDTLLHWIRKAYKF